MSIYTTPLQFGYFLALLIAVLLLFRGFKEERLSDKMLAAVLFLLAMEIQDYTFGFAGINILWEEFNGFPRHFNLAFAPTIYFYLKTQINRDFKFKTKEFLHYLPYAIYFIINLLVFLSGKDFVQKWQANNYFQWIVQLETIIIWVMYFYYFYKSLKIYNEYRKYAENHFSDTEIISFDWLRNFIYLIICGEVFKYAWQLADYIYNLPFQKDWWWHLFTVGIICYVALKGYSQIQPNYLQFLAKNIETAPNIISTKADNQATNYLDLIPKIEKCFEHEKVFLEPELNLNELARKLNSNSSVLSAAINQSFGKNFNDFVNEYRIKEFENELKKPENRHYTKLAVALDCGFNSKATFNRALKKFGSNF